MPPRTEFSVFWGLCPDTPEVVMATLSTQALSAIFIALVTVLATSCDTGSAPDAQAEEISADRYPAATDIPWCGVTSLDPHMGTGCIRTTGSYSNDGTYTLELTDGGCAEPDVVRVSTWLFRLENFGTVWRPTRATHTKFDEESGRILASWEQIFIETDLACGTWSSAILATYNNRTGEVTHYVDTDGDGIYDTRIQFDANGTVLSTEHLTLDQVQKLYVWPAIEPPPERWHVRG